MHKKDARAIPSRQTADKWSVYTLEKKNNKAKRGNEFHTTQEGESLHDISQKYGIKLKMIYKMNPMYKRYAKIGVGDIIRLR